MAAQLAAARGAQVSGIDAAEALVAIARSRVPEGDFHQGDIEEFPFADEMFDVATGSTRSNTPRTRLLSWPRSAA
jgi:ubiquinone/menaquinone biosynthesis C-methylase UbiE